MFIPTDRLTRVFINMIGEREQQDIQGIDEPEKKTRDTFLDNYSWDRCFSACAPIPSP